MRLLNTSTLTLEEFFGSAVPEYAILSHRWLDDEVSFQDLQSGRAASKAGYAKIRQCCAQAVRDGLAWAWVDTCCIDKTSSAELNEAINSMYAWYRESALCYAFLSDVPAGGGVSSFSSSSSAAAAAAFEASAWFTRGWTLQELIAPAHVVFYDAAWERLGTRDEAPLTGRVARAARIDAAVLRGEATLAERSVAQRMAWAASRTTTRPEDRAYSLLGLFGVNMPMLYGEGGARAFRRLQEEIMKASDDQSLFAWGASSASSSSAATAAAADGSGASDEAEGNDDNNDDDDDEQQLPGLLASSPADFAACADIVAARQRWNQQPYSMTNRGLAVEMATVPWGPETFLAALDCEREGDDDGRVGIFLRMLPGEQGQYARVRFRDDDDDGDGHQRQPSRSLQAFTRNLAPTAKYRKIYVRQRDTEPSRVRSKWVPPGPAAPGTASSPSPAPVATGSTSTVPIRPRDSSSTTSTTAAAAVPATRKATAAAAPREVYGFYIRTLPIRVITVPDPTDPTYPLSEVHVAPGGRAWDDRTRVVTLPAGGGGTVAAMWLRTPTRSYALKVGFDGDFNPVAQYGGMLSSPGAPASVPHGSPEAMLHPSWMAVPRSDYLFRGDRLRGGLDEAGFPWRVRIRHELVLDKKMWVLDIEDA
ncbi:HET domain-containing protein [Cordyceps javanica]|uniref:HET domain-containing protein n=1 Tax=Cordyceps javanica TaxID=43265 RepID=A0A545VU20_9HYPO|nr:HET domain-containing protein [Cordyceps javanica]TQW05221.1 HET domain-containing protein [Cordyceps javanica]